MEFPSQQPLPDSKLPVPEHLPKQRGSESAAKKVIIATAIVSVVAAIAAICAVAVNVYTTNRPEYLLTQAFTSLGNQSSLSAEAKIQYSDRKNTYNTTANVLAFADLTDNRRREVTIGVGGDNEASVTIRQFEDGSVYGRAANLPRIPVLLEQHQLGISRSYQDTDTQLLLRDRDDWWYALTTPEVRPALPAGGAELRQASRMPTSKDTQQLARLYRQYPFMSIKRQFDDTTIRGENHAHMQLGIDSRQFLDFARAAQKNQVLPLVFTSGTIQWLERNTQKGEPTVEVWINRQTHQFGRIKFVSPGQALAMTIDISDALPPGKTAVDKPQVSRDYDEAAAHLQELLVLFGVKPQPKSTP